MSVLSDLLAAVRPLAEEAGRTTLGFYGDTSGMKAKADGSPVTLADEAAEAVILPALRALTPDIPVVSEEEVAQGIGPARVGARFWLVDPLDGTREFLNGNGEFTVNIALIEDGRPVLGVVVAPALGQTYAGTEGAATLTDQAGERAIAVRAVPPEGLTVVGSRSHGDATAMNAFLDGRTVAAFRAAGSSLKLCLVAAGEADLYPRLGTTMEWDIAAGHAVLAAAGGGVTTVKGGAFAYGKPDFRNPHFVAHGKAALQTALLPSEETIS
ncbi:3'(2'),5'-bisphosphate nucleotidase CysQ [Acidisoma silvae]|uniref:3'(2'),5'-bisphosphate nucleotidase CysQ n=1 Tax=Acidisoma silvae TaxID=2802396 RepID=A0A963YQK0_9PROT|nr:3'(2'),5'-bisphosphate nucleotidase CysQ [Acidisoma silvae]MCB8874535.1 3'(2'),5'-bisphosphate nucleotidase CysQ [Acidisoma silvae]